MESTHLSDLGIASLKDIQSKLSRLGYYPYKVIDGINGYITENAVKSFAKDHWLNTYEHLIIGNFFYSTLKEESSKVNTAELSDLDIESTASKFHLNEHHVRALLSVESNGKAFWSNAKPPILFEAHQLYKNTNGRRGSPTWDSNQYKGGVEEYDRLLNAMYYDYEAALMSASWGLGQVLGSNWKTCGCRSVTEFVKLNHLSAKNQLIMIFEFLESNNLTDDLRNERWHSLARGYNGPNYKVNGWHTKIAEAFEQSKWNWYDLNI